MKLDDQPRELKLGYSRIVSYYGYTGKNYEKTNFKKK